MDAALTPAGRPRQVVDAAEHRPARAEGVELIGVLPGSGFDETQFLVSRGGQYVQLTLLLFRTLEAIDGDRTLAQIAAVLTSTTEWTVAPEQVGYLIDQKLVPLELVAPQGAPPVAAPDEDAAPGQPAMQRSLLMVQAPRRLIGAPAIERVARITQHLFAPLVVVALLLLALVAHAWMFLGHGISNGFLAVLYSPGLLVLVLAGIVVAALVHEFGHASALRYGGGRAKSIGVGLYLAYPAFFTDVSESYTLPRAGRLRTDLGGIYFHLLFGTALIGLFQVTGWEFLLFTVVLIDIEAVRQVLPFGRLDGYWILADVTGIPDPLSQIAPFVRGSVNRVRLEGSRLPSLRPWSRRLFVAYIVLSLPAVAAFLLFLLARLPVLVGLIWDALRLQVALLATAVANTGVVTVFLAVLQIGLIALELGATAYILVKLGALALRGLVTLGRGDSRRRAAAWALGFAGIAGLAFLWGPHVPGLSAGSVSGVQYIDVPSRNHVEGPVTYAQVPPAGGDHHPVWQNCGAYESVVPPENAVHSLEHGAVWLTYRPDAPADSVHRLRTLTAGQSHILLSPLPDNPAPVVATAWGRQLRVDRADDPRLEQFVRAFRLGSDAPERGGPCDNGVGEPRVTP